MIRTMGLRNYNITKEGGKYIIYKSVYMFGIQILKTTVKEFEENDKDEAMNYFLEKQNYE